MCDSAVPKSWALFSTYIFWEMIYLTDPIPPSSWISSGNANAGFKHCCYQWHCVLNQKNWRALAELSPPEAQLDRRTCDWEVTQWTQMLRMVSLCVMWCTDHSNSSRSDRWITSFTLHIYITIIWDLFAQPDCSEKNAAFASGLAVSAEQSGNGWVSVFHHFATGLICTCMNRTVLR